MRIEVGDQGPDGGQPVGRGEPLDRRQAQLFGVEVELAGHVLGVVALELVERPQAGVAGHPVELPLGLQDGRVVAAEGAVRRDVRLEDHAEAGTHADTSRALVYKSFDSLNRRAIRS